MSSTAGRPATEPDRGLGGLVSRAIAEIAETKEIVLRDIKRGEFSDLAVALTRLAEEIRAAAMFAEITEQLDAVPASPRLRRHGPARQHPLMRLV
jgi:hypothetical protein